MFYDIETARGRSLRKATILLLKVKKLLVMPPPADKLLPSGRIPHGVRQAIATPRNFAQIPILGMNKRYGM
jgi:hypothetical protein